MGGVGWQALHYVVGLARLGHDVYYVEDSGAPPYDPRLRTVTGDPAVAVEFLAATFARFGLADRWAYYDSGARNWHGMSGAAVTCLYARADALFNICGATRFRDEHLRCPVRVYVETDPVYEQIKLALGDPATLAFLEAHTHHFTYGENLGAGDCPIPLLHFDWRPTRPPVVLDLWPFDPVRAGDRFTTVATWRNAGKDIRFGGETYHWSKHRNFLEYGDLPRRTGQAFELATEPPDGEAAWLRDRGWSVVDPFERSRDVATFQESIYGSRGEFTVSKDLVVRTRSGWFSDRSVCYLAAGRPVVTQETGFSKFIPGGGGLFGFSDLDEAVAAVAAINADYPGHCRAARQVAAECFDSDVVLARMCQEIGI
jgi:hypothetical protein